MSGNAESGSYYDRKTTLVNGQMAFKSKEDEASESEVSKIIEAAWNCECHSFGLFSAVDWYFVRNGGMSGVGELKTRSHSSDLHPTVFLNVRKWLALLLASNGLGVPAVFIVRFVDCVRWINVSEIDATAVIVGGCKRIVKSRNDIEPIIEVPVADMKVLRQFTSEE